MIVVSKKSHTKITTGNEQFSKLIEISRDFRNKSTQRSAINKKKLITLLRVLMKPSKNKKSVQAISGNSPAPPETKKAKQTNNG